jgi:membrane fusion protein (multidrug efflux system)
MRRVVKGLLAGAATVAVVGAGGWYGLSYWRTGRFRQATDDAYVQADFTTVAPKISGLVAAVLVSDNQTVSAGQVLARIDDRDFRAAADQAKADVDAAVATVANTGALLDQQQSAIREAQAAVDADKAARTFAQQDFARYQALMRSGAGSTQRAQQAAADIQQKDAAVSRDEAALAAAEKQVDVLKTSLARAQAALARDQAGARQAELNLGYATITAPIGGTIGNRSLRVGQYVQAGTQMMAVVPLNEVYVVGNFKETQLTHVRPGQPVDIAVDTFPGVAIHGRVDSLAPASGQEFALLPPDNATGNFTKVVQRIPVRIAIDRGDRLSGLLRPGMSVEPVIDTKATVLAEEREDTAPPAAAGHLASR